MIKHKKVSGDTTVVAGKINGPDWDDDHVVAPGSIVVMGVARLSWTASPAGVSPSYNIGDATWPTYSAGYVEGGFSNSYPVPTGYKIAWFPVVAINSKTPPAAGWKFDYNSSADGTYWIEFRNPSDVSAPWPVDAEIVVTMYGHCILA